MSETPEELEDLFDDPASYPDDSEPDVDGEIPLLNDLLPAEQDFEGVVFTEGEEDLEGVDLELGQSPSGVPSAPIAGPLEPVSAWSEVDEDGEYEELVEESQEPVDEPEEGLDEVPEIGEEDENEPEDLGPAWAKYEVWGRDRDELVDWQLLSTQDYGQDAEAEIENLRTGTRMEFRVRLLSTDNVASEWSELFFYNLPSDLTPPPAPTPPTAINNAGFITHTHDGSLLDEIPSDMSHRVLYAQQMHPAGNPDGPAGDPMRIAEWRGVTESTFTTGKYVASTEHRAWLVAVDTTGNESARSEYVYFTSQKPFDAAEFEERLNAFADGELEDAAYDSLMARLGEFLTVRTDQLVANDAVGNTFTAPLMQSHTDATTGWKLQPSGHLEVYGLNNTSGEPIVRLGASTGEGDQFTLADSSGNPAISMNQSGGLSAVQLTSQGDPHFAGKPLAGPHLDTPRWHSTESIADLMPQGVLAHWPRVFAGESFTAGVSQTGIGIAHLEVELRPNRLYRIRCSSFEMGDRTGYWMQTITTTSNDLSTRPARPSTSSGVLGPRVFGSVPPSSASSSYGTSLSYDAFRSTAIPQRMRVLFVVGNSSGVGNVHGSLSRHSPTVWIEDVGPSTGPKGVTVAQRADYAGETIPQLPEDLSQLYATASTATYTLNLNTRVATRVYTDGVPRFGFWNSGVYYMTLVSFADWSSQPGIRSSAEFGVSVDRWLRASTGNIFQSAVPNFTGFPASFNFDTGLLGLPDQRGVAQYSRRTVPVSGGALASTLSRSSPVLAVGRTGWGGSDATYPASGILSIVGTTTNARLSTQLGGDSEG